MSVGAGSNESYLYTPLRVVALAGVLASRGLRFVVAPPRTSPKRPSTLTNSGQETAHSLMRSKTYFPRASSTPGSVGPVGRLHPLAAVEFRRPREAAGDRRLEIRRCMIAA